MGEQRLLVERAGASRRSATRTPWRASALARRLGLRPRARAGDAELARGGRAGCERRVGERERGVRADHPACERGSRRTRRRKRAVRPEPRRAPPRSGPSRSPNLVSEDRAGRRALPSQDCSHRARASRRSRSARRGGRPRVVPAEQRLHSPPTSAEARTPSPSRACWRRHQSPLQDLEEVLRGLELVGHPARERGVEVGVGAHVCPGSGSGSPSSRGGCRSPALC